MTTYNTGDRVGAILGADEETKTVKVFGYGIYEGHFVPEGAVGFFATLAIEQKVTNPKITLDNGKIVWGCECWWGSEEKVRVLLERKRQAGWKIIDVDINTIRQEYLKEEAERIP